MVRLCMAAAFSVLLTGVMSGGLRADMTMTLDGGQDVVLHDDSTWGYAKFHLSEGDEEDQYITISDGRTICLRGDNTWGFTKGQPPRKKSAQNFPDVFASGSATKKATVDVAVQDATAEALKRVVMRLKPYLTKSKSADRLLMTCVKNEIGESGADVKYTPGWNAEAKISLDKLQVKNIVSCAQNQIDAAGTADSTSGTAEKNGPKSVKAGVRPAGE